MAEHIWKQCTTKKGTNSITVVYDDKTLEIQKLVYKIEDKNHAKVCNTFTSLNLDKKQMTDSSVDVNSKEFSFDSTKHMETYTVDNTYSGIRPPENEISTYQSSGLGEQ